VHEAPRRYGFQNLAVNDHFRQPHALHVRIRARLERAGLVVTRKSGREKLHFLNPVPIRGIYDRWTRKYAEPFVSALVELKTDLEERKCRPSRKRA
jgi:hypothetical protein